MNDKQIKRVIFYCTSCEYHNSLELGMPNYVEAQTEYDSLTEAYEHMITNLGHNIEGRVKQNEKL